MNEIPIEILAAWNRYAGYAGVLVCASGIGLVLYYGMRLVLIRSYKGRYDFVSFHEVNYLRYATWLVLAGLLLYVNTFWAQDMWAIFGGRLAVSLGILIVGGRYMNNVLRFHYPFYVEKRLKRLRYRPRISPDGRKMRLLSEDEEDVYLDEGMQAEESVFSLDYDVWVDEVSGYTMVEKYYGKLYASRCPECQYQTMRIAREEVIKSPTATQEGEIVKYYECKYCSHEESQHVKIAKLQKHQEKEGMLGG